jgi:carbonic anhydrase/acetyltransferase-like protein (isoleucine patch superfamily)
MPIYEYDGKQPTISASSFIHPCAVIIGDVTIGDRCFIAPGVVIRADNGPIIIHDDTSIQDNTVIHVDHGATVIIEKEVIVGHSVVIHDSHIKRRCVIGMGAVLLFGVVCEEGAFVGAGAVVPNGMRVPANTIVAGNPATIIKEVSPEQRSYATAGVQTYVELTETYRNTMNLIS